MLKRNSLALHKKKDMFYSSVVAVQRFSNQFKGFPSKGHPSPVSLFASRCGFPDFTQPPKGYPQKIPPQSTPGNKMLYPEPSKEFKKRRLHPVLVKTLLYSPSSTRVLRAWPFRRRLAARCFVFRPGSVPRPAGCR